VLFQGGGIRAGESLLFMFPKKNRITSAEFKKLMRPVRTENLPSFSLRFFSLEGATAPKCAIVVSKKISNSAVQRNKIKRRIAAQLRARVLSMPVGSAVVAYAKKVVE